MVESDVYWLIDELLMGGPWPSGIDLDELEAQGISILVNLTDEPYEDDRFEIVDLLPDKVLPDKVPVTSSDRTSTGSISRCPFVFGTVTVSVFDAHPQLERQRGRSRKTHSPSEWRRRRLLRFPSTLLMVLA